MAQNATETNPNEASSESQTETRELSSLDVGAIITPPDRDEQYELVDVLQPERYCPAVWALENVSTGRSGGLIKDGAPHNAAPVEVEFHGYTEVDR